MRANFGRPLILVKFFTCQRACAGFVAAERGMLAAIWCRLCTGLVLLCVVPKSLCRALTARYHACFSSSGAVMKLILPALLLAALLPAQALADCREIVANTLAEMRAGAPEWNEDMERIARTAAGSACVKAGGDASGVQRRDAAISEEAVSAGDSEAAAQAASAEGEGDEAWHPLKGFKFNKVTGTPGKKPYERRREVNETEVERQENGE